MLLKIQRNTYRGHVCSSGAAPCADAPRQPFLDVVSRRTLRSAFGCWPLFDLPVDRLGYLRVSRSYDGYRCFFIVPVWY